MRHYQRESAWIAALDERKQADLMELLRKISHRRQEPWVGRSD
jgi:hypothetical protein